MRKDFVLETVYWDAGTARRLLPRLLKGRTRGPVFVTHRRSGPGKVVGPRDVCPDTGLARLSYGQARALLDEHTAVRGPGTGWERADPATVAPFRADGTVLLPPVTSAPARPAAAQAGQPDAVAG
ncbi:MAG: hypothetical protein ACLQDY_00195 [Streptosporangiaceae bacterium]